MNAHIYQELQHLSAAEKRELGMALIGSSESDPSDAPLTAAQRLELNNRLAHHRANPNEVGVSFAQLKKELLSPSH
jgi:putative addiction module component (TIGR02574 family)